MLTPRFGRWPGMNDARGRVLRACGSAYACDRESPPSLVARGARRGVALRREGVAGEVFAAVGEDAHVVLDADAAERAQAADALAVDHLRRGRALEVGEQHVDDVQARL